MQNITIEDRVRTEYPDFAPKTFTALGIRQETCDRALIDKKINHVLQRITEADHEAQSHAEREKWRRVYSSMGLKPSKYFCSFESLHRRTLKAGSLPRINPVVDIYNTFSLEYSLCFGAYDLSSLRGAVSLRHGVEGGNLVAIGGAEIPLTPSGPICAFWNHRDADRTKVHEGSQSIVFIVDDLDSGGRATQALGELAAFLRLAFPDVRIDKTI
jgi:DNA/RNA-binding domain of Phe-tRNA-synthetase-like protein